MSPRETLTNRVPARHVGLLLGTAVFFGIGMLHSLGPAFSADGSKTVWTFESDQPGKIAKGFAGQVGTWEVAQDGDNHVLAQKASNDDDTFNVVLVDGTHYKDVDLSVRLKAVAGELDRGGGLVWRAKDKDNYYIARYNPLEDNFRVYKVEAGKRTQFQSAKTPGDTNWHTLRVTMSGRGSPAISTARSTWRPTTRRSPTRARSASGRKPMPSPTSMISASRAHESADRSRPLGDG